MVPSLHIYDRERITLIQGGDFMRLYRHDLVIFNSPMNYTSNEQLTYLNGFLERLWLAGSGLIRDQAIQRIWTQIPAEVQRSLEDGCTNNLSGTFG
jgi:hypothetical protein